MEVGRGKKTRIKPKTSPLCTPDLHPPRDTETRLASDFGLPGGLRKNLQVSTFPGFNLLFFCLFFRLFLSKPLWVGGAVEEAVLVLVFCFCSSQVYRHGADEDDEDDDDRYINNCYSIHVLSASQSEFHQLIIIKVPIPPILSVTSVCTCKRFYTTKWKYINRVTYLVTKIIMIIKKNKKNFS